MNKTLYIVRDELEKKFIGVEIVFSNSQSNIPKTKILKLNSLAGIKIFNDKVAACQFKTEHDQPGWSVYQLQITRI